MKNNNQLKSISLEIYLSSLFISFLTFMYTNDISKYINNTFLKILFNIFISIMIVMNLAPSIMIGKILWNYKMISKCDYTFKDLYHKLRCLIYEDDNTHYMYIKHNKSHPKCSIKSSIKCIDINNKQLKYDILYATHELESYPYRKLLNIEFIIYQDPDTLIEEIKSLRITSYNAIVTNVINATKEIDINLSIDSFKWNEFSSTDGSIIHDILIAILKYSDN